MDFLGKFVVKLMRAPSFVAGLLPLLTLTMVLNVAMVFISLFQGCSGYKDISSENGKSAAIEEANLFLNSGMCDQAIESLRTLYESSYADTEVRLVFSSAYACKAGFSMTKVISNLKSSGATWDIIVKSLYSNGNDNHFQNFQSAASVLRTTAAGGSFYASARPDDPNVYMIFMQLGVLGSLMSQLGAANESTGAKTQAMSSAAATTAQRCAFEVAVATINDCLTSLGSASGSLSSIGSSITSLCALGGCSNLDPSVCTAAEQAIGDAYIAAINASW